MNSYSSLSHTDIIGIGIQSADAIAEIPLGILNMEKSTHKIAFGCASFSSGQRNDGWKMEMEEILSRLINF